MCLSQQCSYTCSAFFHGFQKIVKTPAQENLILWENGRSQTTFTASGDRRKHSDVIVVLWQCHIMIDVIDIFCRKIQILPFYVGLYALWQIKISLLKIFLEIILSLIVDLFSSGIAKPSASSCSIIWHNIMYIDRKRGLWHYFSYNM